jgi:hypothetical protein
VAKIASSLWAFELQENHWGKVNLCGGGFGQDVSVVSTGEDDEVFGEGKPVLIFQSAYLPLETSNLAPHAA